MSGTSGDYERPAAFQQEFLPAIVDLMTAAVTVFVDSGLSVTLPEAGAYRVHADVRAYLSTAAPVNHYVVARLFNVTAGVVVDNSERIVNQIVDSSTITAVGKNETAPLVMWVVVTELTTLRLEGMHTGNGTLTACQLVTDDNGRTSLGWERIA